MPGKGNKMKGQMKVPGGQESRAFQRTNNGENKSKALFQQSNFNLF